MRDQLPVVWSAFLVGSIGATVMGGTPAEPPLTPTAVQISPLSAELGLVDIQCITQHAARVIVRPERGMEQAVPLRLVGDAGTRPTSIARVSLGEAGRGPVDVQIEELIAGVWTPSVRRSFPSLAPSEAEGTPDWAKGAVWYQVFPERFRNGEPRNDAVAGSGVFPKAWESDWERVEVAELEAARVEAAARSPWTGALAPAGELTLHRAVVFRRRYGGDLQGVEQELDHLQALGVTAIYLTPIFRAASLHKYDATDYRHIDEHSGASSVDGTPPRHEPGETEDPATWTWTPADLYVRDRFIPAIKARGLRVIFDGVWNHTGQAFHAFEDLLANGQSSPYADWYDAQFAPPLDAREPALADSIRHLAPGTLMGWAGWGGRNGHLPAFKQVRVSDEVRVPLRMEGRPDVGVPRPKQTDLAPGPKQHIMNVTRRWMDPFGDGSLRSGIDGWRLDVAADVGLPFWRDWRRHVKSINPNAVLFGEIWHPAWDYFGGVAFDGQMNYPFARAVVAFLQVKPTIDAAKLGERLGAVFINGPAVDLVQMNVLTSHDTDRLVSCLANSPADYDQSGTLGPGTTYDTARPGEAVYRRVELAVALQATYQGSPMIYYGEEWGMHGADDPHSRKPVPWPDLAKPENPSDAARPDVREVYAKWFMLRQDDRIGPALRLGAIRHMPSGSPDLFVFDRLLNGRVVRVAINRGAEPASVPVDAGAVLVAASALSGAGTNPGPVGAQFSVLGPASSAVWTWE